MLVVTEGWEEIRRLAIVEWIEERDPRNAGAAGDTVRATADLTAVAGIYALDDPRLSLRGGRWCVTACGAERPLGPYVRPVVFELATPGRARRIPTTRGGTPTRRCS